MLYMLLALELTFDFHKVHCANNRTDCRPNLYVASVHPRVFWHVENVFRFLTVKLDKTKRLHNTLRSNVHDLIVSIAKLYSKTLNRIL